MRILITGGAGFIGSHTVTAALAAGHEVRVVDNLYTGSRTNLPQRVEFIAADVRELGVMHEAMAGCDAVIHLAALVSVPQSLVEPEETYGVNTTGTVAALEAARRAGVRRFVLASTCSVYGSLPGRKEESSPVRPQVPYAASKLMAEHWTQLYWRAYGMETAVLRYFNVYGPRQRADSPYSGVLARWSAAVAAGEPCLIFGDGEQTRDFVSVHDIAAANLAMATQPAGEWGEIYNVATGASVTLNTILTELEVILGREPYRRYEPPRAGDLLHSEGDSSRLRGLGWAPRVDLHAGLAELLTGVPALAQELVQVPC
ncbi:MAG: NAD-dependent epimerase/dehydratase family protein [Caldilineaceae bacterium]